MTAFRRVAERAVHTGHIWRVAVLTVEGPGGEHFERDVVFSPGAVGVVPLVADAEGGFSVVLVRQYRATLDADLLEIPAGMRDVHHEDPEETARRELIEETGCAPGRLSLLTTFHNSAGMTDALTYVYVATDLTPAEGSPQGPEEQSMEVVQLPLCDALAMVERGEITDAKTVIGLLLAERGIARADSA